MGLSFQQRFADFQSTLSRDANGFIEWQYEDGDRFSVLEALNKPYTLLWLKASGADLTWRIEQSPESKRNNPSTFDPVIEATLPDGDSGFVFAREIRGQALRVHVDGVASHQAAIIQQPEQFGSVFADFLEADPAHTTATGSWQTAVSKEVASPRTIKEVTPYWRDTGGGGSSTDVRMLVAKDASLSASDAPTGPLSDGDGWLERINDNIASGGDGPDIEGPGLEVQTHLVVWQTQATSSQTTGRAQLSGTEDV